MALKDNDIIVVDSMFIRGQAVNDTYYPVEWFTADDPSADDSRYTIKPENQNRMEIRLRQKGVVWQATPSGPWKHDVVLAMANMREFEGVLFGAAPLTVTDNYPDNLPPGITLIVRIAPNDPTKYSEHKPGDTFHLDLFLAFPPMPNNDGILKGENNKPDENGVPGKLISIIGHSNVP